MDCSVWTALAIPEREHSASRRSGDAPHELNSHGWQRGLIDAHGSICRTAIIALPSRHGVSCVDDVAITSPTTPLPSPPPHPPPPPYRLARDAW